MYARYGDYKYEKHHDDNMRFSHIAPAVDDTSQNGSGAILGVMRAINELHSMSVGVAGHDR